MCTVAKNSPTIFSVTTFFWLLLLVICTFQNVESNQEGVKQTGMRNFTKELNRAEKLVNDGDHETALSLLPTLLLACKTVVGREHPLTVDILILIETAYFKSEKYADAVKVAWEIYKIQEKIHGEEHEKTGVALLQLGYTYLTIKKYGKAEGALKKAYRILKSQLGQNGGKTIDALFELANVYRQSQNPEKLDLALRYYKKVHHVWSTDPEKGEQHEDTRQTLFHIGSILNMQNKVEEATGVLEKAVAMGTNNNNNNNCWTQNAKSLLFRTLSRAGKAGEAKKVLGKEDQDIDQDEDAIFALVEGKVLTLVKMEKYDKAIEILTEFFQQEISKPQVSFKIMMVLGRLIHFSRYHGDLDTMLGWANVMIDLSKGQHQNQKVNVEVTTEQDKFMVIRLHLNAIESSVYAYAQKKDEQNLDLYVRKIVEVMKGQKVTDLYAHPLLSTIKTAVTFKLKLGKKDEAIKVLRAFLDQIDRPRWGAVSLFCLSMMIEISQQNPDYYREIDNMAQKFWTNPRNLESDLNMLKRVDQMIFKKANQLFDEEQYQTAFGLYKVLDLILPTNWTDDEEFAPVFLQRVIKSAMMMRKSDQVLFYMRKNVHALKIKLAEPAMDLDEREKIIQEIEKLQAFQEQIKVAAEIPKDVEEYINSRDFFWPKSKSKSQSKENQDTREKTEL